MLDDALYQPAPDDWLIAVSDVVGSRKAIAAGSYKAVNMAGVADDQRADERAGIPRTCPSSSAATARRSSVRRRTGDVVADTMARTVAWVKDDLGLDAARRPGAGFGGAGRRVSTCSSRRRSVSEAVNNYAFRGGGLSRAEALMKAGEYRRSRRRRRAARPDLTGLSCRWSPIKPEGQDRLDHHRSRRGRRGPAFRRRRRSCSISPECGCRAAGSPMPAAGLDLNLAAEGLELEARATRGDRLAGCAAGPASTSGRCFAWFLFTTGIRVGGFRPEALQGIYFSQYGL